MRREYYPGRWLNGIAALVDCERCYGGGLVHDGGLSVECPECRGQGWMVARMELRDLAMLLKDVLP